MSGCLYVSVTECVCLSGRERVGQGLFLHWIISVGVIITVKIGWLASNDGANMRYASLFPVQTKDLVRNNRYSQNGALFLEITQSSDFYDPCCKLKTDFIGPRRQSKSLYLFMFPPYVSVFG